MSYTQGIKGQLAKMLDEITSQFDKTPTAELEDLANQISDILYHHPQYSQGEAQTRLKRQKSLFDSHDKDLLFRELVDLSTLANDYIREYLNKSYDDYNSYGHFAITLMAFDEKMTKELYDRDRNPKDFKSFDELYKTGEFLHLMCNKFYRDAPCYAFLDIRDRFSRLLYNKPYTPYDCGDAVRPPKPTNDKERELENRLL